MGSCMILQPISPRAGQVIPCIGHAGLAHLNINAFRHLVEILSRHKPMIAETHSHRLLFLTVPDQTYHTKITDLRSSPTEKKKRLRG